jgi:hypothetical protein
MPVPAILRLVTLQSDRRRERTNRIGMWGVTDISVPTPSFPSPT